MVGIVSAEHGFVIISDRCCVLAGRSENVAAEGIQSPIVRITVDGAGKLPGAPVPVD